MDATRTAWERYHRRAAVMRGLIARIEASGGDTPLTDPTGVLVDEGEILVALHDTWSRRLEARVEMALEMGEDLPTECVETAWFEVAAEMPGVRRVLDAHAQDPVLRKAEQHEHRLVAIAAGMVGAADPLEHAAAAGARLVANIRAQHVEPAVPRPRLRERLTSRFGGAARQSGVLGA